MEGLHTPTLEQFELVHRGKVRDVYAVDDQRLLIVATDRLSAYDVILPDPIPRKGEMLTAISNFWFRTIAGDHRHHLLDEPLPEGLPEGFHARAVLTRRLKPLPVEAIVRGYIIGSGWRDYQKTGQICGIELPEGLHQGEVLPEPIFTPSTKAQVGDHDENVSFDAVIQAIGQPLAERVRNVTLDVYQRAAEYARKRGIIIADTKMEFGLDAAGELYIIDELLTPDSSRFWPVDQYQVGISPPSFDKQYVRDYLDTLDWDKTAPGPSIPATVIANTVEKYREASRRLIG